MGEYSHVAVRTLVKPQDCANAIGRDGMNKLRPSRCCEHAKPKLLLDLFNCSTGDLLWLRQEAIARSGKQHQRERQWSPCDHNHSQHSLVHFLVKNMCGRHGKVSCRTLVRAQQDCAVTNGKDAIVKHRTERCREHTNNSKKGKDAMIKLRSVRCHTNSRTIS